MKSGAQSLDLLDTSVLVHLARRTATGLQIEAEHHLAKRSDRPLFSTLTEGEITGLARFRGWNPTKLAMLASLLGNLVRVEAGLPEVVDAYADLYGINRRNGLNLGLNDLWIAATARATKARLLTCDRDFQRIPNRWIDCLWIDPRTGNTA